MKLLALLIFAGACWGQAVNGYTAMPNTSMLAVCPPTNFQPLGGGMPAYGFAACSGKMTDFSSAVADTKRNRLFFDGGGHGGYQGNEKYALDLVTQSTTIATCGTQGGGCGAQLIRSTGSIPAMVRLNDPSTPIGGTFGNTSASPPCGMNDGSRPPEHTWGGQVYLPKNDKVFEWLGANSCIGGPPGSTDYNVYLIDPVTMATTNLGPPTGLSTNYYSNGGVECALNPFTAHETVICLIDSGYLVSIDIDAGGAGTILAPFNNIGGTGGGGKINQAAFAVVDPDRKVLYFIGNQSQVFSPAAPHIWTFDMTQTAGSWNAVEITANVTGCGDWMSYAFPSAVWDPSLHRIVGYIPRTAASSTAANAVIIFDPANSTCVTQPLPSGGGAGPAANFAMLDNGSGAEQGMFGRFNYFPALGYYVLCNDPANNCYYFYLSLTASNGQGASTLTCLDRDGDSYGVGPGCTGPDADDQDKNVHTSAQFLAKWTTLLAGLQHLGYNPANIWYMSPSGVDTGSPAACKNTIGSPCATAAYIYAHGFAAGDMILRRNGAYTEFVVPAAGSVGLPSMVMDYPGELSTTTSSGGAADGFDLTGAQGYVVIDGGLINGSGASQSCIAGGGNNNTVIRHVETNGCAAWGIDIGSDSGTTVNDLTVSDSVFHDISGFPNTCGGGGQHGVYVPMDGTGTGSNIFIYRSIAYDNCYTGFQLSGQITNAIVQQTVTYSNLISGHSWKNGVSNSRFLNNVSINDDKGMTMFLYDGSEGGAPLCGPGGVSTCTCAPANLHSVCPYPQNNNEMGFFSAWLSGTGADGVSNAQAAAIQVGRAPSVCTTSHCLNTHMDNTNIHDNVMYTNNTGLGDANPPGSYPSLQFPDNSGVTFLPTTTITNLIEQNIVNGGGAATHQVAYGPGASFGYAPYTCAQLVTNGFVAAATGCSNADPKFVATCAYNAIGSCNLKLQATSPAVGTGAYGPSFDVIGNPIPVSSPNMGAFQGFSGSPPPTVQSVIFGGNVRK